MLERTLLRRIVEAADLTVIDGKLCLTFPADDSLVDELAAFGAEEEDMELEDGDTWCGAGCPADRSSYVALAQYDCDYEEPSPPSMDDMGTT